METPQLNDHKQSCDSASAEDKRACIMPSDSKPATGKTGYLDKMGDENLLKGSYWTFRVITSIIWASPDDGSSA